MITFSSLVLKGFFDENMDFLTSAKIQKIQQPSRKELIFHLRNHSETKKLYINISPSFFHVCFASDENLKKRETETPKTPPMFCMLLRKYIENARIVRADVPDYERILELFFETDDEVGDKIELCLAIELMGKYSNVILYNTKTNIIVGCMHNVGEEKSRMRELSGGLPYIYPPKKEKKNLLTTSKNEFELQKPISQNDYYYLTYQILEDFNYDYEKLNQLLIEPEIFINDKEYSFIKKDDSFHKTDFNTAIDFYYSKSQKENIFNNLKSNLKTTITKKIQKQENFVSRLKTECKKAKKYEEYKLFGDLITANIYKIKQGDEKLVATDYEKNCEVEIILDKTLSPSQNAQKYYKMYSKFKKANTISKERLEENEDYLNYLKEIDLSIELCEKTHILKELKQEFELKNQRKKVKHIQNIEKREINGFEIYIGKNHFQNDFLLSKIASPNDMWVHLRDYPSAHVIVKSKEKSFNEAIIFEASKIVKSMSKARNSSKVCVIYTLKKFVKKIPKSKYGLVNYREEKEIVLD